MTDRPPVDATPVDIIILSGFLGSGKTTLLGDFLQGSQLQDTAVIVNEVGEIGIDAAVLNERLQDDDILMLDNGCVCCSLRSSLVESILRLLVSQRPAGMPPLRRVIVETSGLSMPGPIVASLKDRDLVRLPLRLFVLSTFDITRVDDPSYYGQESLAQWAASHRIVLTKVDCLSQGVDVAVTAESVHALNPLAQVVASPDRALAVSEAFAAFEDVNLQPLPDVVLPDDGQLAHADLLVAKGSFPQELDWQVFSAWVDDLAGLLGDRLLRFKALIAVEGVDQPVLLQSVGTTFSAPVQLSRMQKSAGFESNVILIARGLNLAQLQEALLEADLQLFEFVVPSRQKRRVFDVCIDH